MPRVKGKVIATKVIDGKLFAKVAFDRKSPKEGEYFTAKWGSVRSLPQNALYWKYLNWLIEEGGLRDQGHFIATALHDNLKVHILGQGIKSAEEVTTTDHTKSEFSEYFQRVDEFVREFFEIDTTPFWEDYQGRVA